MLSDYNDEKTDFERNLECQCLNQSLINSDDYDFLTEFDSVLHDITELWQSANSGIDKKRCIDLVASSPNYFIREELLIDFSMESYEKKDYPVAFWGFCKGAQLGNNSAKNNLAYMLRRHEYEVDKENVALNSLKLLMPGLRENKPFNIVNAAMVMCLLYGQDNDWKVADRLFAHISDEEQQISDWWSKLDDIEGPLVHFFLLRHNKINSSGFGSIECLAWKLSKSVKGFPVWLRDEYAFESLEEVLFYDTNPDYDLMVQDYLESMSHSRDSVDIILGAWKHNKNRLLYNKLISDYCDLLGEDEKIKIEHDFIIVFNNPFATKLVTIKDVSKCLSEVSSQEEFDYLYEYTIRISEHVTFSSEDSLWGRLLLEIVKGSNTQYVAWLVNWFQCDDDNKWWPLIPVNRVFAEVIRLSCQYDKPECIEMLRNCGTNYASIREECWDEPCVAYDKEDDEHSSPLAFAIEANSKNCYMTLLKWMSETNSSISHEGEYVWSSNELKDVFTEIPILLKEKKLDWPTNLE